MASRNAIEVFDPSVARQHAAMELRAKVGAGSSYTGRQYIDPSIAAKVAAKMADFFAKEGANIRAREEERRRRDPTYRPDAIDLSTENVLPFDKYVDYYARLGVDQYASALELKRAYMRLSLALHPDKVVAKSSRPLSDGELSEARSRFHEMNEAHEVLSDMATRREYDRARDSLDAHESAGLVDAGRDERPPPTCVDVTVTLPELFKGCTRTVRFTRQEFANTKYAKRSTEAFAVRVYRGESEGATVWHRSKGDVGPLGRADLVFVIRQAPHPLYERAVTACNRL